jgi:hypothetical protein
MPQSMEGARVRINIDSATAQQSPTELKQRAQALLRAMGANGLRPVQIEIFDLDRRAVVASYTVEELQR